MRALWIVAAGSCLALGLASGVANASPDPTDAAGSSDTESSQSSEAPTAEPEASPKDVDGESDSSDDSGSDTDSDTSTTSTTSATSATSVSASTVIVRRPDNDRTTAETSTAQARTEAAPAADTATDSTAAETKAPEVTATKDRTPAVSAPAAPVARSAPAQPVGPLVGLVLNALSTFGLLPAGPPAPAVIAPSSGTPSTPGAVTGVVVGRAPVDIPVGASTYTGAADWYFPTQQDGTVQAEGVMWLQHGFLGDKSWYSALAQRMAQQTNSVVVVANVPSFPFFTCSGCALNDVPLQQGVASLFVDADRAALNASATAAGYQGTLPTRFVLTGHSAGGGLATAAGGFYVDAVPAADNDLLGVVMYDGVSSNGTFATAIAGLNTRNIPVYQIAAPPQPWNADGRTTADLLSLRPGRFVGDVLANGSHVDSLIGGVPTVDLISQLLIRRSPPGNTAAVYTLAGGWINDMYAGRGPDDALYGIYGAPGDYVLLGDATAVVLGSETIPQSRPTMPASSSSPAPIARSTSCVNTQPTGPPGTSLAIATTSSPTVCSAATGPEISAAHRLLSLETGD